MQFSLKNICRSAASCRHMQQTQIFYRHTSKIAIDVETNVLDRLEANELNPRQHPGILKLNHIELPKRLSQSIVRAIGDYPIRKLVRDGKLLNQYINARHPPPEKNEIQNRMRRILDEIDQKMPLDRLEGLSEEEATRWRRKRETEINKRVAQRTYAWKPINYGPYEAIVYATARGAQEYAVLQRIMRELVQRDAQFKPRSYFDFGSGVGTGMWVASELWRDSIYEYYNVDCSRGMNELSELILRNGQENKQMELKNVFYRQFLPGLETKYDLMLVSHTLFEMPTLERRKEILLNLWRKCDGYLIIVEEGTRRGSELVNEARRFLLSRSDPELQGHTFAPCPHDVKCPRLADIADRTPCNFEISYSPLNIGELHKDRLTALYSYAVLKKGSVTDATRNWPRIVRPTLVRSKHAICRMCTEEGKLQEVIFTQSKHGKPAYRCAKVSRWGDRLPIAVGATCNTNKINETHAPEISATSVDTSKES